MGKSKQDDTVDDTKSKHVTSYHAIDHCNEWTSKTDSPINYEKRVGIVEPFIRQVGKNLIELTLDRMTSTWFATNSAGSVSEPTMMIDRSEKIHADCLETAPKKYRSRRKSS